MILSNSGSTPVVPKRMSKVDSELFLRLKHGVIVDIDSTVLHLEPRAQERLKFTARYQSFAHLSLESHFSSCSIKEPTQIQKDSNHFIYKIEHFSLNSHAWMDLPICGALHSTFQTIWIIGHKLWKTRAIKWTTKKHLENICVLPHILPGLIYTLAHVMIGRYLMVRV